MIQHKRSGFTVVELIIVIVVVALLATITTIAYRSTQASARDEKRKADVTMLNAAVEEYYARYGAYPLPDCTGDAGSWYSECWNNQAWQVLKNEGYISKIPTGSAGSTANYAWFNFYTGTGYAIRVQLEDGTVCKMGKGTPTWVFGSASECTF